MGRGNRVGGKPRSRAKPPDKWVGYMGIDPGITGGASILLDHNSRVLFADWHPKNDYGDVFRRVQWLIHKIEIRYTVLEQVGSRPGQDVRGIFTFGTNYGAWMMLLGALDVEYTKMIPQNWQRGLLRREDGREPKERVRGAILRLFGPGGFFGPRGGYRDGRGDSAMMAYRAKLLWEEVNGEEL